MKPSKVNHKPALESSNVRGNAAQSAGNSVTVLPFLMHQHAAAWGAVQLITHMTAIAYAQTHGGPDLQDGSLHIVATASMQPRVSTAFRFRVWGTPDS